MTDKINHWCVVCGKGYHACDSCNEVKTFTPWRSLTDTLEHYKLFMVLKDYNNKLISKAEAQMMLSSMNLSGKENFKEGAKKVLNEIFKENMSDDKKPKKKFDSKNISLDTNNVDSNASENKNMNNFE